MTRTARRVIPFSILTALVLSLSGCRTRSFGGEEGASSPFSFVVFGDNQFATDSRTSGVPERMALPRVVLDLAPDLLLHTGDLMDHGRDAEAYERFRLYYEDMLDSIPFFPTMGNHDAGYAGIANYKKYLEEQLFGQNRRVVGEGYEDAFRIAYEDERADYPGSFGDPARKQYMPDVPSGVSFETFYAFRYRNVYFLSLEQGTRWWANTPRSWLERRLREAREDPSVDHIVVFLHHPMYSTTMREEPPDPKQPGNGECIAPVRRHYEELFRTYDVTLVFSGHAHLYDRFYVPDDDHPTRRDPPPRVYPNDGGAIHYIVTGGGGGPLNRGNWCKERSYRFFQKRACTYHVIRVQVDGRRLEVSVHAVKGSAEAHASTEIDRFVIGP